MQRNGEVEETCESSQHQNECVKNGLRLLSGHTNGKHHPHRKLFPDDDHEVAKNGDAGEAVDRDTVRYPDGTVRLRNPNIELMDQDILYHLALGSGSHDLVEMFGDVKFVCMGGTPKRMEQFAYTIMAEIGHKLPCGTTLQDISQFSYRYSMYKVGPVLCISQSRLVNIITIRRASCVGVVSVAIHVRTAS